MYQTSSSRTSFGRQVALAYLCPSQLSLRVGVKAKVNDGRPYTRLSEPSNSYSRGWRGGSQQQRYCVCSFGLRGSLDTQRGLDALPVLLYSLLIVAGLGAMAQTSRWGSATGLSCLVGPEMETSSIASTVQCTCTACYLNGLFVLSVFALVTPAQREWFILALP